MRNLPRVTVTQTSHGPIITMTAPGAQPSCTPLIYFNGLRIDVDQLVTMPADLPTVVEVYHSWLTVPAQSMGSPVSPCGVVLYWSKFIYKK